MDPQPVTEPRPATRRRLLPIAIVLLLVAVTGVALLAANRGALKIAFMQWRLGPPPAAQVYDAGQVPAGVAVPVRAGDQLQPDLGQQLYFSPWNWGFSPGQAVSNTPGAYFKVRFTGDRLVARFNVDWLRAAAFPGSSYPVITTRIDGGPAHRQALGPNQTQLDLLTGQTLNSDPDHAHTAVVTFVATHFDKGDRWQTPVAALRLTGLDLAPGATLNAPPVRPRRVLVFGDSHGEGVELLGAGSHTIHQDAQLAYPQLIADAWDAEVGVVAFGGVGFVEPVAGANMPPIRDTWTHCWHNVSRRDTQGLLLPQPHVILSALGDNDPDHDDVSRAIDGLAQAWRAAAPDAEILFALPPNQGADGFRERLAAGLSAITDPNLRVLDPGQDFLIDPALSFGNHLNANGQAAYARALLEAYAQPSVDEE